MKYAATHLLPLLKSTYTEWGKDKAPIWGAALAYYTVFSLGPLLLVILAITGLFFGREAVRGDIFNQMKSFLGPDGAKTIELMIKGASKPTNGIIASLIGLITLILGASGIFGQMKQALNFIWKVQTKPHAGIMKILMDRFINVSMIGVICFLLLVSLVASASVSTLSTLLGGILPFPPILIEIINFLVSLSVTTVLFTLIYKVLPDIELPWQPAWVGGIFTALLFTLGKTLIGLYLGQGMLSSSYGAAASLITLLVWVYYTSQILFFGAEFIKSFVKDQGIMILPSKNAELTTHDDLKNEKMPQIKAALTKHSPLIASFFSGFVLELVSRIKNKSK